MKCSPVLRIEGRRVLFCSAVARLFRGSCSLSSGMFSTRVPQSLEANRITQAVQRARAESRPIVDLTITNPTTAGFEYPDSVLDGLSSARGLTYAPQPFGLPGCPSRRRVRLRAPWPPRFTGAHRADRQHERGVLAPLQAALRARRRRGDGASAELSAVRSSDRARRRAGDSVPARLSRPLDAGGRRCGRAMDAGGPCRV